MALDHRLALAFMLTALCTISSKSMASRSCCSISTLMEGLKPSRKEQIMISSSGVRSNSDKMDWRC